jgi:hypothetical protein
MKTLEFEALQDAAERPDGWALFKRKTTEKLVARGWFVPAVHKVYGSAFQITQAGRDALAKETGGALGHQ